MKKITLLFMSLMVSTAIWAQCPTPPTPDYSYCYDSNEVDVVIAEACPATALDIATVEISQGNWEAGFDSLTVYEGAPGSGTTGTIVFGPADGDLSGTIISATTAGNCLIFVSNSDSSVSCASGARPSFEAWDDAAPPPPSYDNTYCYDNNETDVVMFEMTPDQANQTVNAQICVGNWEAGFDDLTVYEGAPGSGTTGTIVFGPADGDLSGTIISSTTPGSSLIFVSNSDSSVSCASGSRPTAQFSREFVLSTADLESEVSFSYYPNPVNNTLTLNAQNNIENVRMYNMLGQEVMRVQPQTVDSELDMSGLETGTYFVQVTIANVTKTVRVVKQ